MKLIINIDENIYRVLLASEILDETEYAVKNGTPIPDNATNGDILEMLFPNAKIHCCETLDTAVMKSDANISIDWWNAPYQYQKGGK